MTQSTLLDRPYVNSNLFSNHYLDERLQDRNEWEEDDKARAVFEEVKEVYESEKQHLEGHKEDQLLHHFIDPILEALGYDSLSETKLPKGTEEVDRLLFSSSEDRQDASILQNNDEYELMYERGVTLLEAKQWDFDFSKSFSSQRSYANASSQVRYYLEKTPPSWGVLTDGRKWRLYWTQSYRTDIYYEVDLPELIESDNLDQFKYFYLFFRPEAFTEQAETSFLDEVVSESETAAQELGEDLQDNVFTALRILGRGFTETNNLRIQHDDQESLDELKEQSLVLLYRLMFVLYAESRDLIHPSEGDAAKEYIENFSLDRLRYEIHEEIGENAAGFDNYSEHSTSMWGRLEDLFRLIDEGAEDLGIPPYNGGLFDHEKHNFLTENEVSNRYLAEVIYRLSTTENDDGDFVLADYADLDTRHLGSVYEGLLEHQFKIAPEEYAAVAEDGSQVWEPSTEVSVADAVETVSKGELYVVNDEGERKATGAYYTPDYVVSYIVEETVGPLIEDIREDLQEQGFEPGTQEYLGPFLQRVVNLKILDPAMGSAHFLTNATGYIAEEVMSEVREVEEEVAERSWDEEFVRRQIAKECIFGVDVNPMAVELGKLSMWLETLAADRPLAFLDHHLKHGNSLVGSDVTEILSNGDDEDDGGQMTIEESIGRVREQTFDHVMDLMQELLDVDNESLEDIKSMEELYRDIQSDDLYRRLRMLANVDTAEEFGVDVPDDALRRMADAIEDTESWNEVAEEEWFQEAQELAEEQSFFHWELEFPAVFFDENGQQREDAGFDGVIGNPPYVRIQTLREKQPNVADYLLNSTRYESTTARFDIYAQFTELALDLSREGRACYILPNKFFKSDGGKGLRDKLSEHKTIREIVDFGEYQIFEDAITYTCILSLGFGNQQFSYIEARQGVKTAEEIRSLPTVMLDIEDYNEEPWVLTGPQETAIIEKIEDTGVTLGDISDYVSQGLVTGDNDVLFVRLENITNETTTVRCFENGEKYRLESEMVHPVIDGDDVSRYDSLETELGVIYPYEPKAEKAQIIPEDELKQKYPQTYGYLSEFHDRLADRGSESMEYNTWYALWRPRERILWDSPKILHPRIVERSEFALDDKGGLFLHDSGYGIVPNDNTEDMRHFLLAVLNSKLTWFYLYLTSPVIEGDFRQPLATYLRPIPLPTVTTVTSGAKERNGFEDNLTQFLNDGEVPDVSNNKGFLGYLAERQIKHHKRIDSLNLSLFDHLGISTDDEVQGPKLNEIGFTQPPDGVADSPLSKTKEDLDSLRVGRAEVRRPSATEVEIRLTARYKPDPDEKGKEAYTETEPLPALRIANLSELEAEFVEAFVPRAVDEADGFAGFRETATKTNSLVDRLEALRLPDPSNVESGLRSYRETRERADEVDEKIEKTDDLIDEIVYELYGLTEEEIETVEDAVSAD